MKLSRTSAILAPLCGAFQNNKIGLYFATFGPSTLFIDSSCGLNTLSNAVFSQNILTGSGIILLNLLSQLTTPAITSVTVQDSKIIGDDFSVLIANNPVLFG
jgi:hypothetical protein